MKNEIPQLEPELVSVPYNLERRIGIQKHHKLKLCTFPKPVLLTVIKSNYMPALSLLLVLYETCFLDWEHKNPVTLTTESLRPYRISRGQKERALNLLEKCGVITVLRCSGKNPKVRLNWTLPWE